MPAAPVVTRFAPSPTGYLHIGGARTALFNWLYARHTGGSFLLRIEDTDRARSTPEATAAIFEGLTWLGLDWDGEAVSQFARAERHAEVARAMLDARHRLSLLSRPSRRSRPSARRRAPPAARRSSARPGATPTPPPRPDAPVRRPAEGAARAARPRSRTWCRAAVTWKNETLDDLILLRSDGTPTYMLAVVVDDHDMGVTHVIRGDDHLTNAARQTLIYRAMGWHAAGLRAHPADPRPRRREALQAPRRARGRGLPRHGLPAGGDAQLPRAARLEPRQRRVLHHRAGDRLVRPRPPRQGAGPIRPRQARGAVAASTSAPPTTRRCSRRSRLFLQCKSAAR